MTMGNVIKLIKKDFRLAMHPTVPLMLLTAAMVTIPNPVSRELLLRYAKYILHLPSRA